MDSVTSEVLPVGETIGAVIQQSQVEVPSGGAIEPTYAPDAAATLVMRDYERARNWLEQNSWYMEWEWSDLLHQSPTMNQSGAEGSNARVNDFSVNDAVETMGAETKRQLFAQQVPFVIRPRGKTSDLMVEAWTALCEVLCARAKLQYNVERMVDCSALQGTSIGKMGWNTRTRVIKVPKRRGNPEHVELPIGGEKTVATKESRTFDLVPKEVKESWPFFEYRELGSTIFDPKWNTPNHPELCGYSIDVDYVNWHDLEGMRQLDCYDIPAEEALKQFFFQNPVSTATSATQIQVGLSSGSAAQHAEIATTNTSIDPLATPVKLIHRYDDHTRIAVLCLNERYYTIQNEPQDDCERKIPHVTANWRNLQNAGYGIGLGRLVGCLQRVRQGIVNHSLRSLAYRFNAPLMVAQGSNAPTGNVLARLGGFFPVQPLGNDVRKAAAFLELPPVPPEAWSMLQWATQAADQTSGADQAFAEGNISQRGSSAARTATGASRIAQKSDQRASTPINAFADAVITPFVEFLIDSVKMQRMPIEEIHAILTEKLAGKIEEEFDYQEFFDAQLEVRVLAGAKLAAKQSIAQVLPFFLQIFQQPQLLEQLHEEGETIDYGVISNLILQYSELVGEYDIFRQMTPQEQQAYVQSKQQQNPKVAEVQGKIQQEQVKGQNKIAEVQAKGEMDLRTKMATSALERLGDGIPLQRAQAYNERAEDEQMLRNGAGGGL